MRDGGRGFYESGVDVAEEARGTSDFHLSVAPPVFGAGEDTVATGACDGHIEQATLFLELAERSG